MPRATFVNLQEDKKQQLIDALKREFSRVPLFEASIANIVKSASIPRGSFYQYFEDKEDAFFFLLNEYVKELNNQFIAIIKKHKGDLFEAVFEFFEFIVKEDSHLSFLRNTFLNMTYKIERAFTQIFCDRSLSESFKEMGLLINMKALKVNNETELFHALRIITTVTFRSLMEKFAKNLEDKEALESFKLDLQLLRQGLLR